MKSLLLFLTCCSLYSAAQTNKLSLCDRLELDQYDVYSKEYDDIEKKKRIAQRRIYFVKNFNFILDKIRKDELGYLRGEKCYGRLIGMTLVHMAQTNMVTFLEQQNLDLIITAVKRGNIQREFIAAALYMTALRIKRPICKEYKERIDYLIRETEVNTKDVNPIFGKIENIEYRDCF